MLQRIFGGMRPLALALGLMAATVAQAEPLPLSKEEQAKVDKAIDKAISYLKDMQTKRGTWEPMIPYELPMPVGTTALPALALLEAGVPPTDPVVEKAAECLRSGLAKLEQTYDVSLTLLFLDRLGDPQDKPAIRSLALRLIVGQSIDGGWGYRCPTLSAKNEAALPDLLRQWEERSGDQKPPRVPPPFNVLTVFQDPSELPWLDSPARQLGSPSGPRLVMNQRTDNSNTQFAILALWAARRHGVPVKRTLQLVVRRFESSQASDGRWGYHYHIGPTQYGVVALHRGVDPRYVALVKATEQLAMTTVGVLGLALRHEGRPENSAPPAAPDLQVLRGFAAVSRTIGEPTGQMKRQVPTTAQQDLYYLWSLERLAMLYDLPTIGGKDWYRWGAEILVTNQLRRGCWGQWDDTPSLPQMRLMYQTYGGTINTAFALLFLKRSHLLKELTPKLPYKGEELEKGIVATLQGRPVPAPSAPSETPSKKP